jgi:hypothetical protein
MARSAVTGAVPVHCGGDRMTWGWKSPIDPARGTISRTARVSIVRWNLKEAEGKALARRTGIAYKAAAVGKKANIFKARYLHGNCGRRCGRHKCEGHAHYPGRSEYLPLATGIERCRDGYSEVSRGHSRLCNQQLKG